MKRESSALTASEFDLLIVGAGIFGACAALDAAMRGLRVAIVDRGDFGGATSANSYKIAHGGVRYLQHGDIPRIIESSREQSALLRVAGHLVRPLPIMIPTYGHGARGKEVLRLGFGAYDLITAGRNRGIRDASCRIPRARFLSRAEALHHYPALPASGLTGAALFHDAQMYNTPRLTLAFLRSAAEAGAVILNYAEVRGFLREGARIHGVTVNDGISGGQLDVRARVVLNAAGPWAVPLVEERLDLDFGDRPTFSRDVALVTRRRFHPAIGLACPAVTRDADAVLDRGGRHLFLLPWRGFTLVGVWHGVYSGSPDELEVSDDELGGFVAEANQAYPGLNLASEDVVMVNTGLILFGQEDQPGREHSFGKRSLLVDHARRHRLEGLVTLVGVRATTARGMAEAAVDLVLRKLGRRAIRSATARTPVWGGDVSDMIQLVAELRARHAWVGPLTAQALGRNYGSGASEVLDLAETEPGLQASLGGSPVLAAEVAYAARVEMAQTLDDVVQRRTDLGTAENPGGEALVAAADVLALELNWDNARRNAELSAGRAFFARRGALRTFCPKSPVATERRSA